MNKPLVILAFSLGCSPAYAVSFDCNKASTFVEYEICSDALLGKLDDVLTANYRGMLDADFGSSRKSLKAQQLNWLRARNKCTNMHFLISTYLQRIDETCEYGVVTGVHPECTLSEDIQ